MHRFLFTLLVTTTLGSFRSPLEQIMDDVHVMPAVSELSNEFWQRAHFSQDTPQVVPDNAESHHPIAMKARRKRLAQLMDDDSVATHKAARMSEQVTSSHPQQTHVVSRGGSPVRQTDVATDLIPFLVDFKEWNYEALVIIRFLARINRAGVALSFKTCEWFMRFHLISSRISSGQIRAILRWVAAWTSFPNHVVETWQRPQEPDRRWRLGLWVWNRFGSLGTQKKHGFVVLSGNGLEQFYQFLIVQLEPKVIVPRFQPRWNLEALRPMFVSLLSQLSGLGMPIGKTHAHFVDAYASFPTEWVSQFQPGMTVEERLALLHGDEHVIRRLVWTWDNFSGLGTEQAGRKTRLTRTAQIAVIRFMLDHPLE